MEECGPCPIFASYTPAFALQLRKKHGKTSVKVAEEWQYTFYILQKHPHITKTTHIHITKLEQHPPHRPLKQVPASRLPADNNLGALYLKLQNTV